MELPGRVTDGPFGLIYQCKAVSGLNRTCVGEWETVARHPSPLYQAFTEGVLLFLLVWFVSRTPRQSRFSRSTRTSSPPTVEAADSYRTRSVR